MAMLRTRRLNAGYHGPGIQSLPASFPRAFEGPIYTCPPGYRAIIRDLRLASTVATTSAVSYFLVSVSGGSPALIWSVYFERAIEAIGASMDVVLHPGDVLRLATDLSSCYWYVSGAEVQIQTAPVFGYAP